MNETESIFNRNLSIKEIILIFSDIDVKLTALNECSADDFLAINNYLKKYYKDAKRISYTSNEIYDIVAGKKHEEFYTRLTEIQQELKQHISVYKDKIKKSVKGLEKMLTALNLMFVPIKNTNLNLLTLNFLIENLRLNIAYSDEEPPFEIDQNILPIKVLLNNLKNTLPKLGENLQKVKSVSRVSSSKLIEIRKRNILDIDKIINQVNTSISILTQKQEEAAKKLPEFTQRSNSYFESVNKIITNLQYHDIIRQKMEHVQSTHKDIIKELNSIDPSLYENMLLSDNAQQFLQIKDIANLQIAQLLNTNKEYQKAFTIITKKLWDIGDDMSAISSISSEFTGDSVYSNESFYKDIEDKLKNITHLLKRLLNANYEFSNEINLINQTIEKKEMLINDICALFNHLNTNITNLLKTVNQRFADDPGVNSISSEIQILCNTINESVNDIEHFYKQSLNICTKLKELNKQENENGLNQNLFNLSQNINDILNSITEHNEKIDRLLTENSRLGLQISSEIKSAVEQVKYYDFFEKIILEIINELNSLNSRLDSKTLNALRKSKKENLESLEKRYTMETQRIIHQKIIDQTNDEIYKLENQAKDEETDVEFF